MRCNHCNKKLGPKSRYTHFAVCEGARDKIPTGDTVSKQDLKGENNGRSN